jgi:hypothetical protein
MNHASDFFDYKENLETNHKCKFSNLRFIGVKQNRRYVTTTDGKKMLVWTSPQILMLQKNTTYCGGPQSALTQFYSFRWNFN